MTNRDELQLITSKIQAKLDQANTHLESIKVSSLGNAPLSMNTHILSLDSTIRDIDSMRSYLKLLVEDIRREDA